MRKTRFCWESGIFIAILTGEQRPPEELSGLREVMELVERNVATVVVSASATGEVLNRNDDPTVRERFNALFKTPSFFRADTNQAIWERAAAIREAGVQDGRRIKTPDAVHIATAIEYRVDALHTFDGKLLKLSGKDYVEGLKICTPHAEQMLLL
jgi:predicted nucleic acid-binding protein